MLVNGWISCRAEPHRSRLSSSDGAEALLGSLETSDSLLSSLQPFCKVDARHSSQRRDQIREREAGFPAYLQSFKPPTVPGHCSALRRVRA